MRKLITTIVLLFVLSAPLVFAAAGDITVTKTKTLWGYTVYTADWVTTTLGSAETTLALSGKLLHVETIPGASGDKTTLCPTTPYTLYMKDPYGLDVAAAAISDRSVTVAQKVTPTYETHINNTITLTVVSGGSGKKGRFIILMQ
jgi:hypothetical protein